MADTFSEGWSVADTSFKIPESCRNIFLRKKVRFLLELSLGLKSSLEFKTRLEFKPRLEFKLKLELKLSLGLGFN